MPKLTKTTAAEDKALAKFRLAHEEGAEGGPFTAASETELTEAFRQAPRGSMIFWRWRVDVMAVDESESSEIDEEEESDVFGWLGVVDRICPEGEGPYLAEVRWSSQSENIEPPWVNKVKLRAGFEYELPSFQTAASKPRLLFSPVKRPRGNAGREGVPEEETVQERPGRLEAQTDNVADNRVGQQTHGPNLTAAIDRLASECAEQFVRLEDKIVAARKEGGSGDVVRDIVELARGEMLKSRTMIVPGLASVDQVSDEQECFSLLHAVKACQNGVWSNQLLTSLPQLGINMATAPEAARARFNAARQVFSTTCIRLFPLAISPTMVMPTKADWLLPIRLMAEVLSSIVSLSKDAATGEQLRRDYEASFVAGVLDAPALLQKIFRGRSSSGERVATQRQNKKGKQSSGNGNNVSKTCKFCSEAHTGPWSTHKCRSTKK
jgi:hypothetical protein